MTLQVTIIGLGQIGGSIGLALGSRQDLLRRVGHDLDVNIARRAEKMGAVDRIEGNLPNAVRNSEIIILSMPVSQIKETLEIISQDMKEGAVVMDTSPLKEVVGKWAGEILPAERHYVGLAPAINPIYLDVPEVGLDAARADLFSNAVIAIAAPTGTHSDAIKLAADLTRLLGATPLFADPAEIDGLMAVAHLLPELLAAALVNVTIDQPGWREARKFAGRAFAEATGPLAHLGDVQHLKDTVLLNQNNIVRVLDGAISVLQLIRNDIQQQNQSALGEKLDRAIDGRERWWLERNRGEYDESVPALAMPDKRGVMGRMFGLGWKGKQPKDKSKP
jgi:prephenate dehydrogenase